MKKIKIFILLTIVLGVCLFFGIKKFIKPKDEKQSLNTEFASNAIINVGKKNYECEFSRNSGNTKLLVKKPENISGLTLEWHDGKQKVSLANLQKEFDANFLPKDSFLNLIVKILDNLPNLNLTMSKDEGGYKTFSGKIEDQDFELSTEDSKILEIYSKSKDARISFE